MKNFEHDVRRELLWARTKHAPVNSLHEGYAVLHEEMEELFDCVRQKDTDHEGNSDAYKELVQIGAMAQRVAEDAVSHDRADAVSEGLAEHLRHKWIDLREYPESQRQTVIEALAEVVPEKGDYEQTMRRYLRLEKDGTLGFSCNIESEWSTAVHRYWVASRYTPITPNEILRIAGRDPIAPEEPSEDEQRAAWNARQKAEYNRLKAEGKAIEWRCSQNKQKLKANRWGIVNCNSYPQWLNRPWYEVREKPAPEPTARDRLVKAIDRNVPLYARESDASELADAIIAAAVEAMPITHCGDCKGGGA